MESKEMISFIKVLQKNKQIVPIFEEVLWTGVVSETLQKSTREPKKALLEVSMLSICESAD
jgi:hypothetical protein